jgi:hypothetical protein
VDAPIVLAPDMIQCDTASKAPIIDNEGKMLYYDPWYHRCCQHNVAFGWPYFTEHLWMATPGNGLAAVMYAPSRVSASVGRGARVTVTESTSYPFGDAVLFRMGLDGGTEFPLVLRIPGWCTNARILVNGGFVGGTLRAGTWAVVERAWKDGDSVRLELPANVAIHVWRENGGTVSVSRGALTYSLKIGERWQRCGGTDAWPALEAFPATAWNYGLVVDARDPASSIRVVVKKGEMAGQPFTPEGTPVELIMRARRIPAWRQEANGLIGQIPSGPLRVDTPEDTLTLVPMGCARLRLAVFPLLAE